MKQLLKYLLFFCLPCLQLSAAAAELKIAFATDRPPYCFRQDNLDQGIEIDLLRQIMGQYGHTIKVSTIPKVRLIKAVKEKEVDAAATVQDDKDPSLYFSDPYLEFQNMVISKSKQAIELKSLQDLSRFSFIIWQDGWKNLGPEFEAKYRPDTNGSFPKNYHQAFNQLSQNKMFWADRVQLIIIDKTIFQHHQRLLAKEFNTSEALTYHDLIKSKTSYAVVFQRAELRQQFNEGLKKIRANGIYQKIIDSYK
ncbi:substrate-binding periplasmic protein [Undibacterium baiyunense]|uniref:Transporter substrate-binding domain-containing protein n=1 Tax=Undibacterium baiyunense TaxID=2828731 RepID=A0A941I3G2_9BURK|nr:transporter substrate-binding domain-containing protein [Undibacterium baiyunense]MBR7746391.1 transporter substrate-binding domain-containing protein [Undibacterium baiyunense]